MDDADANPTNEFQTLSQDGNEVSLSDGGGVISVADDDNDPSNEIQNIASSKEGNIVELEISNGSGTTIDVSDSDADPVNEMQTVSVAGYEVTLSDGGGTFMTGTKSYTQAEIDALTPYNGLTVHNSTTNCINYYYINNWFEACGSCTPMPSQPMAGNDTIVVGGIVSLYLYANTPETGSALWSILSGEGGSFADITDPNTLFTGQPGTSYILQWAISTSCGTISDEVIIVFWQCSYPVTDSRDGQSYTTLQIGDQCWMTENLNIGTRIAGSSNQTDDGTLEKYCFDNSDANCDVYGGLYQWNEMMQYTTTQGVQGVCMEGWHLPTDDEWCALEQEVDPSITCSSTGWRGTDGGTKLKQGGSSGFEALLGGYRNTGSGSFNSLGTDAYFWSSSESGSNAWGRGLGLSSAYVYRLAYGKTFGFSVRCLKD